MNRIPDFSCRARIFFVKDLNTGVRPFIIHNYCHYDDTDKMLITRPHPTAPEQLNKVYRRRELIRLNQNQTTTA